jgi:hypothetical protein
MFDPRELATALHAGEVDFVIIGGLAVAAHGYVRATKDLDIVPSPEPANLDRSAMKRAAGRQRDLDDLRELGAE